MAATGGVSVIVRARDEASNLERCLHWLQRGYICVVDPRLAVEHDHTHDSLRAIYDRAQREARGYAAFLETEPYGVRALAHEWWSDLRWYDSPLRARLSPRRTARLLGAYAGRRPGRT